MSVYPTECCKEYSYQKSLQLKTVTTIILFKTLTNTLKNIYALKFGLRTREAIYGQQYTFFSGHKANWIQKISTFYSFSFVLELPLSLWITKKNKNKNVWQELLHNLNLNGGSMDGKYSSIYYLICWMPSPMLTSVANVLLSLTTRHRMLADANAYKIQKGWLKSKF